MRTKTAKQQQYTKYNRCLKDEQPERTLDKQTERTPVIDFQTINAVVDDIDKRSRSLYLHVDNHQQKN